jgi:hypothetical protein
VQSYELRIGARWFVADGNFLLLMGAEKVERHAERSEASCRDIN